MDSSEQAQAVEELERRFEHLRALYEQYFLGIEKLEPLVPRKDVDRRMWLLRKETIRNTGLRFRFQQVVARYSTFTSHWQRITREIENGTFRRDVARAHRRFGTNPLSPPEKGATNSPSLAPVAVNSPEQKPSTSTPPAVPRPKGQPSVPVHATVANAALPDSRIKEIYSQYVVAKRKCSESTADVTLEQLTQSLREASTKLKQKHPTGVVDFEVVVRNGHALLKPVVRGM